MLVKVSSNNTAQIKFETMVQFFYFLMKSPVKNHDVPMVLVADNGPLLWLPWLRWSSMVQIADQQTRPGLSVPVWGTNRSQEILCHKYQDLSGPS